MHPLRVLVLATCAVVGVLGAHGRADAHGLHATVTVTDTDVKLEAFYDEELPADVADVTVTDADGNVVQTGKTDDRGLWSFPKPKPGTYKLVVSQIGHVARRSFEVTGPAEPDTPAVYGGRPLNKWVGLSAGLLILLVISGVTWLRRRRARRLE